MQTAECGAVFYSEIILHVTATASVQGQPNVYDNFFFEIMLRSNTYVGALYFVPYVVQCYAGCLTRTYLFPPLPLFLLQYGFI